MNSFPELIGTALLHFIWQGALIALLLAITLFLLKKSTAHIRYSVSWVALIIMILLPAQSIWKEYHALQSIEVQVEQAATIVAENQPAGEQAATPDASETFLGEALAPVMSDNHAILGMLQGLKPYLALFWGIGVVLMTLRLFGGWMVVNRLKTKQSEPVSEAMQALFDRLVEQAGIGSRVFLRQTKVCTEVLLIGWIKPAVLLPVSVVTEMSTDHIEAVIAHELAHVKRYDYVLAGIQAVIETLLFYHPAVWWVSRQIRVEREHCCDDLAVDIINDRARYARALYELEAKRNTFLRVALSANDGSLLSRISRLATARPARRQNMYMRNGLSSMLVVMMIGMSLVLGSCTDFSVDSENPVSVGVEFKIPEALESMIAMDDRDGVVEYLHRVRNEGDSEQALEMTLGAYAQADKDLRYALMFVIAHINTPEGDDALLRIAETDPAVDVRKGALRGIDIRIVEDPVVGEKNIRGVDTPLGQEYTYQAMGLERERALTSGLQHIAQDNEEDPTVRMQALNALSHRDDLGGFFEEVIASSTDDLFTLQAINLFDVEDQYISDLIVIYRRIEPASKNFALSLLGSAGAMEALPLMLEGVIHTPGRVSGESGSHGSAWAISNLYETLDLGGQMELTRQLESKLSASLDRDEQAARDGFASEAEQRATVDRLYRMRNLLINLEFRIGGPSGLDDDSVISKLRVRTRTLIEKLDTRIVGNR